MMQPVRPTQVDVALLYKDYEPFEYEPFAKCLELIFGGHSPVHLGAHVDGRFGIISVGGIIIKISQNTHPLEPDGFQSALASPFTQMVHKDAATTVARHRKTVFVTVGSDDILTSEIGQSDVVKQLRDVLGEDLLQPKTPSKEAFSNWIFVARIIVDQLCSLNKPDIIHWCQSDQFFSPEEIATELNPVGMSIQIHPSLYSSGIDENGRRKLGWHAYGSEHLTDYHVIVRETSLPFAEALRVTNEYIYALSGGTALPPDGYVVPTASGAALRVFIMEANGSFPRRHLEIEVLEISSVVWTDNSQLQTDDKAAVQQDASARTTKQTWPWITAKILIGLFIISTLGPLIGGLILLGWYAWSKNRSKSIAWSV